MSKMQIKIQEGISDDVAMRHVWQVVNMGFVSNNNTQYCYVTQFGDDVYVSCDRSKTGTHLFQVYKESK